MYEIGTPERDKKRDQEWNVVVRWIHPSGSPVDGPGIIIADESTRKGCVDSGRSAVPSRLDDICRLVASVQPQVGT